MRTIFTIAIICLTFANAHGQDNIKRVQDSMRMIGFAKADYYWYVNSGNEKFNKKQFNLAEKDYLMALHLLNADTIGKKKNLDNFAVGQLVINQSLLEVNQGLKDKTDIVHYTLAIRNLEQEFSKAPDIDISAYFETQARDQYRRKDFRKALRNSYLSTASCRNTIRKKSLVVFQNELEAMNSFMKKQFTSAIKNCNVVLAPQPGNMQVLDLRGRIYHAMGCKNKACVDWNKAYSLNFPISKLRMNKYCN